MRTLTIGFSKSTKPFAPFSWALQLWDHVPYSHVYFVFENSKNPDIPLIYQASGTALNFMSTEVFLEHSKVVREFELEVTEETYNEILRNSMRCAGRPYGIKQVVGIAIAEILHLNKNPFPNKDGKFVCSEWVAKQMILMGYQFFKDLDLVKPIDVYEVLEVQLV